MAAELPYLPSYKNVGKLFEKIASAKIPEAVTTQYLYNTLGLKTVTDRALISLLKALGFLDASNKPSPEYSKLKNPRLAAFSIASGIKTAYAPLFEANEKANELPQDELKGLIAQVAGSDTDMTSKILGTLNALLKISDFGKFKPDTENVQNSSSNAEKQSPTEIPDIQLPKMQPEFHYNIQIHLPSNASEETYLNIFNAVRKSFQ